MDYRTSTSAAIKQAKYEQYIECEGAFIKSRFLLFIDKGTEVGGTGHP